MSLKKNMFLLCGVCVCVCVCVCSLTVHSAKEDSILTISETEEDVDTNQM